MTQDLHAYRAFLRLVETGSFTKVAREFGTSQPSISRQISALEEHLGARLVQRTTRSVTPTEEGRRFYDRALQVLETVQEAEASVGRGRVRPTGRLRVAAPVAFSRLHLLPRIAAFLARYPDMTIDLIMHDNFADLVAEGIDVAIRVGDLADPTLIAKRLGETRRVAVASPKYLKKHREPKHPRELADHACICYTLLATGNRWLFDGPSGPLAVEVTGPFQANNSEGVREAVVAGLGIGVLPIWVFKDEIDKGLVKLILQAFEPKRLPLNAVYPSRRFVPAKVRAFIDYLEGEFRLEPTISAYSAP
ncbi:MAG: LysR family transcriptional regulator [Dongiaceae bacterium]